MSHSKQNVSGKKKTENRKYDSAWKRVIKQLFKDFLEFFFTDIYQAIDFTKEIVFLDKELKEIDPDSTLGDRVADVLVKVHLKDGTTKYICIIVHIEVQGQPQPNFMERMFIYFYRAFDKEKEEKIPVMSVAVLTDDNPKYRPDEYKLDLFGFELKMRIPIVKITDFKKDEKLKHKLETSASPMAMVVLAQLKSHEVKQADDPKKFEVTKELIRQCYKNGYSRDDTRLLLKFFDWVIRLPEAYKESIKEVIEITEEEFKMEYVPIWERDAEKRGEEEGIKKGEKRGEDKKARETARKMIARKFDIDTIIDITGLKREEIEKMAATSH
jgi:predicted transposase/invertase (TIGR01784 family)